MLRTTFSSTIRFSINCSLLRRFLNPLSCRLVWVYRTPFKGPDGYYTLSCRTLTHPCRTRRPVLFVTSWDIRSHRLRGHRFSERVRRDGDRDLGSKVPRDTFSGTDCCSSGLCWQAGDFWRGNLNPCPSYWESDRTMNRRTPRLFRKTYWFVKTKIMEPDSGNLRR